MPFRGPIFYLSEDAKDLVPVALGIPTGEELRRVPPEELEKIYLSDPYVFNGINMYYETIMYNPPRIVCSNEREQKYMDAWARRVSLYRRVIPKICQNMLIYGNAWNEICYNRAGTDIVKLPDRDPKYMDFKRTFMGRIEFDEYQEPAAYVQYLPWWAPKQPNEVMQMGRRAVLIPKEKIMHTPFITIGDSFDGVGLIEPLYNAAVSKQDAEKGFSFAIHRLGHFLLGVKVGSATVHPTENLLRQAAEAFKDINERSVVAYPDYVQPEIIEPKHGPERLREQIEYFVESEIAGLGLPACLVTGKGEAMNRAILDKLMVLFYQRLSMIQNNISQSLEEQVFTKIAEDKGFDEVPKLEWPEISIESLASKADRLASYAKAGIIQPDKKLENLIRRWENLPER